MRGRKPVPPPGGEVVELPTAKVRPPECPATLPEGLARASWEEVTRALISRNVWDADISFAVEAYCTARAHWLEAEAQVREQGLCVKSKRGRDGINPWVKVANSYFDRMCKVALELGLTPVSRGRVTKAKRISRAPAAKFLGKGD
jgi:P27 family predicted phage terminase small subunit